MNQTIDTRTPSSDDAATTATTPDTSAATPAAAVPALPDRLSIDPRSPYYLESAFAREVGIRFNGRDRSDVEEYCVSEGWIKVAAGKTRDRKGQPLLLKLKGKLEVFYR